MDKRLIDADKLLEDLKKEAEFCIKEKFSERNTRFYLGRETVLTDIIRQIESGKFDLSDPISLPTIKQGDKVRHKKNEVRHTGHVRAVSVCGKAALVRWTYSNADVLNTEEKVSDLEVSHD